MPALRTVPPMAPSRVAPARQAVYSSAEVALLLDRNAEWFYEHRLELHAKGMPKELDLPGQRRYSRAQIDAWLAGHDRRALAGKPPLVAANDAAPVPAGEVDDWNTYLRARYATAGR